MNENSVDKFLLANKIEIEDNGFSDRVMHGLPAKVSWQRRMGLIWNCIFIVMLVVFCWQTDVLDKLMVDVEVFVKTMPIHMSEIQWWYGFIIAVIGLYGLVFLGGKKLINN